MAGCPGLPRSFTTKCQEGLLTARCGAGHGANKDTHAANILDDQQPNERTWNDNLKENRVPSGAVGGLLQLGTRGVHRGCILGHEKKAAGKAKGGQRAVQGDRTAWELRVLGVCKGMRRPCAGRT